MTLEIAPREFLARLVDARDETPGARTLRLAVPDEFTFIPGMFVMTSLDDDARTRRAYSIASSPLERSFIELTIGRVGEISERLCLLPVGRSVRVRGPFGKWLYRDEARSAVLISGGTGLTPFRSMTRYVLDKKLPNQLAIVHSARTPRDIIYREELETFRRAGISVYTTITRPTAGWDGPTGRVDVATIERVVPDFAGSWYYLCGPNAMVQSLADALRARGIPPERVRTEKWGDYRDL